MRKRLGDTLLGWGVVTRQDLDNALAAQAADARLTRRRLGRVLLDQGRVSEWTLATALADMHGLPSIDLTLEQIDDSVARRVPQSVELQYLVLPLWEREGALRVAVADPLDVVAVDDLRMRMPGIRFEFAVAPESQLRDRILEVWREVRNRAMLEKLEADRPEEPGLERIGSRVTDAGSVAAVSEILEVAVRAGASDIHVEPGREMLKIRIRVDGQLREVMKLPKAAQLTVTARMKIISGLDIVERRLPQDGRGSFEVDGRNRNMRVSTLPTIHGEKIVIRLLPDDAELPDLSELGLPDRQADLLRRTLQLQQGLVLVTGPTGAGKSTTLYSAIRTILDSERNLISLEDPVEVELPNVTQVQINDRVGMTFASGLRSALRQDPDVIMVGEIRDLETAELAVRAALTGHLVVSTLHTLDAASAVVRLMEMGIPSYLVAPAIVLSMAQRLVRQPCRSCLRPDPVDPETARRLHITAEQASQFVAGEGCGTCGFTGYSGRVGIYELLPITAEVRSAVGSGQTGALAQAAAGTGWQPLLAAGVEAALAGQTTAAELLRALTTNLEDASALNSAVESLP